MSFTKPGITFQATVVPTKLPQNAVLDYLSRGSSTTVLRMRDYCPDGCEQAKRWLKDVAGLGKVGLLWESDTGFGAGVGGDLKGRGSKAGESAPAQGVVQRQFIDLPFPVSVSQVEAELEKLISTSSAVPNLPPSS